MDKIQIFPNNRKFNPNSNILITQVLDQMNQIIGRNDPNWTKKNELEMKPNYGQNSKITQQSEIQPKFLYFNHPSNGPNEPNCWKQ